MAPTIRIDEEVYSWLKGHARPFEDTPNSVLRRLAGLGSHGTDPAPRNRLDSDGSQRKARSTERSAGTEIVRRKGGGRMGLDGKQLNDEWKIGARHALFSRDGSWYENLERFPGALFDPHGYVLFRSEQDYRKSPYVRIGKKTNVSGGISSVPGYIRKA